MKVTVAVVGRLKEQYLLDAETDYLKRLRRYCTPALVEHKDDLALSSSIPAPAHLYVLDERGDNVSSEELSGLLAHEQLHGAGAPLFFAIGGADGHPPAMRARATRTLAFGRITIAHRLVRLLLLEQLYRGFTILKGEPYHRA